MFSKKAIVAAAAAKATSPWRNVNAGAFPPLRQISSSRISLNNINHAGGRPGAKMLPSQMRVESSIGSSLFLSILFSQIKSGVAPEVAQIEKGVKHNA
jgi:hypothetical protein